MVDRIVAGASAGALAGYSMATASDAQNYRRHGDLRLSCAFVFFNRRFHCERVLDLLVSRRTGLLGCSSSGAVFESARTETVALGEASDTATAMIMIATTTTAPPMPR